MTAALLLLLAALGSLHTAFTKKFEVKDGANKTCIIAELLLNFTVTYDTVDHKENHVSFSLPEDAVVDDVSTCGNGSIVAPQLGISFGAGHSVSFNFSRNATLYYANELTFVYSLGDKTRFPNASSNDSMHLFSENTGINAQVNTTYVCVSVQQIPMAQAVLTLSTVKIEAYVPSQDFSKDETRCEADKPATTTVPTTATAVAPTQRPVPGDPTTVKYNVTGSNGTCLLAQMGLQLNVTYTTKDNKTGVEIANIESNATASGFCDSTSAGLSLKSENSVLWLFFSLNTTTKKSYLSGVNISINPFPDAQGGTIMATNTSLHYLQASLGKSFRCSAKQILQVTPAFAVSMFKAQVQAFMVDGGKFGEAEECLLDQNNMLIPIIVGAALAGLVLIVLIAYLIGRKRSHAGYQTI